MASDDSICDPLEAFLHHALLGEAPAVEDFLVQQDVGAETERVLRALGQSLAGDGSLPRGSTLPSAGDLPFERLGDFRLISRIGAGGMGMVFLAEQESIGRLVALKIMRPEIAGSTRARERFVREARAAGRLQHPNIVTIHEAGEDKDVPFLAMELVPGRGLDEILAQSAERGDRLPIRDVLRWCRDLAQALSCAHEMGFVHRDLKPANVRITPDGHAVLLDFGLARDRSAPQLTLAGEFHGSAHYASPEQVAAGAGEIDARTDLYSLGVTLYQCLTGRVPFSGATTERIFREILHTLPLPPRRLVSTVPLEVQAVALMALEKRPQDRYASATALAADLNAILEFRPVAARPPTLTARLRKWARRRPEAALAVSLGALLLIGLPLVVFWQQGLRLQSERHQRQTSDGLRFAAESSLALPTNPGLALLLARESIAQRPSLLGRNATISALHQCKEVRTLVGHSANVTGARFLGDERRVVSWDAAGGIHLWDSASGALLRVLIGHSGMITGGFLHPDGERFLTASHDQTARIWDLASGESLAVLGGHRGWVRTAGFSADGSWVATASSAGKVRVWKAENGQLVRELAFPDSVIRSLTWSDGGEWLAAGGKQGSAVVWRTQNWEALPVQGITGHEVVDLSIDPSGRFLLCCAWGGVPSVYSLENGSLVQRLSAHDGRVGHGCFDPSGEWAVTTATSGEVFLWSVADGSHIRSFRGIQGAATQPLFNPRGTRLAAGSWSGPILVWDAVSGELLQRLDGHGSQILSLQWSQDGQSLLSAAGGQDRCVRIWQPERTGITQIIRRFESPIRWARFSPDAQQVVVTTADAAAVLTVPAGDPMAQFSEFRATASYTLFHPEGSVLITADLDSVDTVWSCDSGELLFTHRRPASSQSMVPGPPGMVIACLSLHQAALLDAISGETRLVFQEYPAQIRDLHFHAASATVAIAWDDGVVRVFDAGSAIERVALPVQSGVPGSLSFSGDGKVLVAGSSSTAEAGRRYSIDAWNLPEGRTLLQRESSERITLERIAADGSYVAVSIDGHHELWPLSADRRELKLVGHDSTIRGFDLSPDGRWAASGAEDATIRVWNAQTGEEWFTLRGHQAAVTAVEFSADGRFILSASTDGSVRRWSVFDFLQRAEANAPREFTSEERERFQLPSRY